MKILIWAVTFLSAVVTGYSGLAQGPPADKAPIQTGYAVVTPSGSGSSLAVFETFGRQRGNDTVQAGVLPSDMTKHAVLFVSQSGRLSRYLGVAIANPGNADAVVRLTLRDDLGTTLATQDVTVEKHKQTAKLVSELFSGQPSMPQDLTGSLDISSETAVAVVGLRFRGENFSTLPVTNLSLALTVPVISDTPKIGGDGSVILAQFAIGGGWASEIVVMNTGSSSADVRVDLFKTDGTPLTTTLDDESGSSFTRTIPAGGVVTLAPKNGKGDSEF